MKVMCEKCRSFVCDIKNKDKLEIHKKSNECIVTDIVLWNIIKNTNFESLIN